MEPGEGPEQKRGVIRLSSNRRTPQTAVWGRDRGEGGIQGPIGEAAEIVQVRGDGGWRRVVKSSLDAFFEGGGDKLY